LSKEFAGSIEDLLGDTIQNMLEAELDEHLGYESTNQLKKRNQITVTGTHQKH